jgi:hypothetical protein
MILKAGDKAAGDAYPVRAVEARFRPVEPPAVLGTPLFIIFEYRNITRNVLSFAIGSMRSEGFRFVPLTLEVSQLDPYREFGGLEPVIELGPGEEGSIPILLNRYLSFPFPGRYSIEAQFDFEVRDHHLAIVAHERVRQVLDLELREDPIKVSEALGELEREVLKASGPAHLEAIDILGALRSEDAVQILAKVLEKGEESEIEAALNALGRSHVAGRLKILDRFIASTTSARLRDVARNATATAQRQ